MWYSAHTVQVALILLVTKQTNYYSLDSAVTTAAGLALLTVFRTAHFSEGMAREGFTCGTSFVPPDRSALLLLLLNRDTEIYIVISLLIHPHNLNYNRTSTCSGPISLEQARNYCLLTDCAPFFTNHKLE